MSVLLRWLPVILCLAGCAAAPEPRQEPKPMAPGKTGMANPASTHCIVSGGSLMIRKSPSGEYGVCAFRGKRQCEEWALLRGQCPAGGVPVDGIPDDAGRYCVITGGRYLPAADGAKARCAFGTRTVCDVADLFAGKCQAEQ